MNEHEPPTWLELQRVLSLDEAARQTGLHRDSIRKRYPQFVLRLSPHRLGIKLKHVLEIGSAIEEAGGCESKRRTHSSVAS